MAGLFGNNFGDWFTQPIDPEGTMPTTTRSQVLGNVLQNAGNQMMALSRGTTPAQVPSLQQQATMDMQSRAAMMNAKAKADEQKAWQNMFQGAQPAGGGVAGDTAGGAATGPAGPGGIQLSPSELNQIKQISQGNPTIAKTLAMELMKKKIGMQAQRGSVRMLTPEEKAAEGFPPNAIVSVDHTGQRKVVDDAVRPPIGGGQPAAPTAAPVQGMSLEEAKEFFEEHLPGPFTPEQVRRLQLAHNNPEMQDKVISEIFKGRPVIEDKLRGDLDKKVNATRNVIRWGNRAYDVLQGLKKGEEYTTQGMEAVYLFMKALDPESVVRPGEVALASSIASMKDQVIRLWETTHKPGGRLPRASAEQLLETTVNLAQSIYGGYGQTVDEYAEIAKRRGVNPENVTGGTLSRPGGDKKKLTPEERQRLIDKITGSP